MPRRYFRLRYMSVVIAAVVVAGGVAGLFWARSDHGAQDEFDLSARPAAVVARYEFAHTHADLMKHLPCYCGCGPTIGHESLFACFVNGSGGNAAHAADCQVCRDEAEDAELLLAAGESPDAIRAFIDARYGGLGAPTNTP
jgi:hypothetical protein